jgi:hypothetical protein
MATDVLVPKNPMVGSFVGCCARAPTGHVTAAPPSSVMNSRRLMSDMGLPPSCAIPVMIQQTTRCALARPAGRWCVILGLLIVHLLVKHAEHHAVIVLD